MLRTTTWCAPTPCDRPTHARTPRPAPAAAAASHRRPSFAQAFIETSAKDASNVDLAFETILIEIYRIVTRKTLEAGGDGARPPDSTQKIVLNKDSAAGGKKKGGCC